MPDPRPETFRRPAAPRVVLSQVRLGEFATVTTTMPTDRARVRRLSDLGGSLTASAPDNLATLADTPPPSVDTPDENEEDATAGGDDSDDSAPRATWRGVIGMEGVPTGDGRLIEVGALRWGSLPIPFRYAAEDYGMHAGAKVAGRILSITRQSGGLIYATGDFDLGSAVGRESFRQVFEGLTRGVSMDLDEISFQIRIADDGELPEGDPGEVQIELDDPDDEGRVTVVEINANDEVVAMTDAQVRGLTQVSIPAFKDALIEIDEANEAALALLTADNSAEVDTAPPSEGANAYLMAAAAPLRPPLEWFADPGLNGPTPLTITDDGRVFGHLATWDTCHTGYPGQCMSPPASATAYAYFRTGSLVTRDGDEVPVGTITMDTMHANQKFDANRTLAHYEHTGRAAADVAAGEDAHGIWVAGALRSTLTDEQIRSLRAAPLSGDWRRIGGNLELIGVLAVNVPGFPVPRPGAMVAGGHMTALVASGMLPPAQVIAPGHPGALSTDDLRWLKRLADRERDTDRQRQVAALGARMRGRVAAALAARVLTAGAADPGSDTVGNTD